MLVFFLFKLLLVAYQTPLNLDVLKFVHPVDLLELFSQVRHESGNVLIRSKLTTITDCDTAKGALLLALSIVSLNTSGAESMQAKLVNDRIRHHLLTDWTSQVLLHTFDEISTDHVVQSQSFWRTMQLSILIFLMIDDLSVKFLLLTLIMEGQL